MLAALPPQRDPMPGSYFDNVYSQSPPNTSPTYRDDDYCCRNSRKRSRLESYEVVPTPKHTANNDILSASISSLDITSPSPLANSDYFLSGGLDTPGAFNLQQNERFNEIEEEADHRMNRFMPVKNCASLSINLAMPVEAFSKRTRSISPAYTISGLHLRKTAWALTGGLAGKIFNFCWETTFKGFSAGGGDTYGIYPDEPDQNLSTTRPQAPNRGNLSTDSQQWVMVNPNNPEDSDTPVRKRRRAGSPSSPARRRSPAPYSSDAQSRMIYAAHGSPRSRTSSFGPSHVRTHSGNSNVLFRSVHSPTSKRPRVSLSSPQRRQSLQSTFAAPGDSPVSPEIASYKRQRKREERKQEEKFGKLNAQLQSMIREGQAALGSKIEIEADHEMDEGYFEDF